MKISNNKFANEEVVLDFHEYESCHFTNCRFVVLGYGPFALNQCEVPPARGRRRLSNNTPAAAAKPKPGQNRSAIQ